MLRPFSAFVCLITTFGCSSARHPDLPKTERLEIAHYKVPCSGEGRLLCMLATKPDGERILLYQPIKGFTFTWGERASVQVRMEEVPDPPMDASSIRITLEKTISRTPEPASFTLHLEAGDLVETPKGLTLLRDIPVKFARQGGPGQSGMTPKMTAKVKDGALWLTPLN
jgi:hypothetical protein